MALRTLEVAPMIQWLVRQSGMHEVIRQPAICVMAGTTFLLRIEMAVRFPGRSDTVMT